MQLFTLVLLYAERVKRSCDETWILSPTAGFIMLGGESNKPEASRAKNSANKVKS